MNIGTVRKLDDGRFALRFELAEDGPAATVLVFTNIVADHGTAAAVAPGWHAGLDRLGARLDGTHALR